MNIRLWLLGFTYTIQLGSMLNAASTPSPTQSTTNSSAHQPTNPSLTHSSETDTHFAINFANKFFNAQPLLSKREHLKSLGAFKPDYQIISPNVPIPKERLITKLELTLRRNKITIGDDKIPVVLLLKVQTFQIPDYDSVAVFASLMVLERQVIARVNETNLFRVTMVQTYENAIYGLVKLQNIETSLVETTERLAEEFAEDFLAANEER
ncbi:MAG: hypothetical protein AB7O66_23425 [Limisphaerales bacterium]